MPSFLLSQSFISPIGSTPNMPSMMLVHRFIANPPPPPTIENGPLNNSPNAVNFSFTQFFILIHIFSIAKPTNCSANNPAAALRSPLELAHDVMILHNSFIAPVIAPSLFLIPLVNESRIVFPASSIAGPFVSIQLHMFLIAPSIASSSEPLSLASIIPLHIP